MLNFTASTVRSYIRIRTYPPSVSHTPQFFTTAAVCAAAAVRGKKKPNSRKSRQPPKVHSLHSLVGDASTKRYIVQLRSHSKSEHSYTVNCRVHRSAASSSHKNVCWWFVAFLPPIPISKRPRPNLITNYGSICNIRARGFVARRQSSPGTTAFAFEGHLAVSSTRTMFTSGC